MSRFHQFVSTTLADRKVCDADLPRVREMIEADGQLDLDDVKLLVELYCGAAECSPAFEELFFSVLERVMLEDGEIAPSEQFYLLKMLYSDRRIREPERAFLRRLQQQARRTPEFDALCQTAIEAPAAGWNVGGRVS